VKKIEFFHTIWFFDFEPGNKIDPKKAKISTFFDGFLPKTKIK